MYSENKPDIFSSNLLLIQEVTRTICKRNYLFGQDAEDFASEVQIKLLEQDCRVLREFREESEPRTYLFTVIHRHYQDFRDKRWGKWRPSTQARRLGPVAMRLEALMVRDGYGFAEACQIMRVNEGAAEDERELARLAARLPVRYRRRVEDEKSLAGMPGSGPPPEEELLERERSQRLSRVGRVLQGLLESLSEEDCLIVKLRYDKGVSVAQMARTLGRDQRRLYRRVEKLLRGLRNALEDEGIDKELIDEIFH